MRLNTLLKVVGLAAALVVPFGLTGCDDDPDESPTDGSVMGDTMGGSDATTIPGSDALGSDAKPAGDAGSDAKAPMGDAATGDAATGDASTNG